MCSLSLSDYMIPKRTEHVMRRNLSGEDEDFEPAPGAPKKDNYSFDMIV